MCFVQHFNLLALILVIFIFGCSTAFVFHSSASYTVLRLSCFCIFFFPPSYAISLSSSNSVSLAASPSRKNLLRNCHNSFFQSFPNFIYFYAFINFLLL